MTIYHNVPVVIYLNNDADFFYDFGNIEKQGQNGTKPRSYQPPIQPIYWVHDQGSKFIFAFFFELAEKS